MIKRVSDSDWLFIQKHLSKVAPKKSWHGRPRATDREVFNGIVWVLKSGARWRDLPRDQFPAKSSCHKRFQQWSRDGSWNRLQKSLVRKLQSKKKLNFAESFIDGSLIRAKKGVSELARAENQKVLS